MASDIFNILPFRHLDEKTYLKLHIMSGSATICENNPPLYKSKAYLKCTENRGEYSLFLQNGPSVMIQGLEKCVEIFMNEPKKFQLAGIDVFWSMPNTDEFSLIFFVNTNRFIKKIEDSYEMVAKLSQYRVAPTINNFLLQMNSPFVNLFEQDITLLENKPSTNFKSFYEDLEKQIKKWDDWMIHGIFNEALNCHLMGYQRQTVKWMIERETRPDLFQWTSTVFQYVPLMRPTSCNKGNSLYYYPFFGIFSESDIFDFVSAYGGGILADDMGLGKTVEMISLIVSHRKVQKTFSDHGKTQKHLNWEEYKSAKNGRSAAIYTVTEDKMKKMKAGSCKKCEKCGDLCELEKCGWQVDFDVEEFWCPQCMGTQEPLEVKTTLIVLPETLMVQWYEEILKHSKDLNVMFYFGLNKTGYLHPLEIAKFDIILTTYSTLTTEMDFTNFQNRSGPRLVRLHKFSPTSLTHVKWWRLVCDEAQFSEKESYRAQMCTRIKSHHRWCMTSTPSIANLYGLFRIIGHWPFNLEQFWKDFDDADEKSWPKNIFFQLALQIMRKNTKKMVEDELQLPKLVEIEKVVKFTKIEENQYKNEVEELRQDVKNVIEEMDDDTLLNKMVEENKVLLALSMLKETLISCGEHTNTSKKKNVSQQVMTDPKNTIFRLIGAKKVEIEKHFEETLVSTLQVGEMYWAKGLMVKALNQYNNAGDIILMIESLNQYFDQVMNKDVEHAQNSNRKRGLEDDIDEGTSGKMAKMDVETKEDKVKLAAERKARKAMVNIQKCAMQPISIECLLFARFFLSVEDLEKIPSITKNVTDLKTKMGGYDVMFGNLKVSINRFLEIQLDEVRIAKTEQVKMFDEWKENDVGMKEVLEEMEKSYQSKSSKYLMDKLMNSVKIGSVLMRMSFWPVFEDSTQHFKDGKPGCCERHRLGIQHNDSECMGICNQKTFEIISQGYKLSTSSQVLQKMSSYINSLEMVRNELFESYLELIDFFVKKSPTDFIALKLQEQSTLECSHKFEGFIMRSDDETRKRMKKTFKCRICAVQHTLSHLRFAIGTGSYHGKARNSANGSVGSFFSMVFTIERNRNPQFDGMKQLSDFLQYLEHLRQTTDAIQSSCYSIIDYSNRLSEINSSWVRINLSELSKLYKNKKWSDKKIQNFVIEVFEFGYNEKYEPLKTACQELRYFLSLYEKRHGEVLNEIENCCPICYLELKFVANYPCGHRSCEECYRRLRKVPDKQNQEDEMFVRDSQNSVQCATCRKMFKYGDVILERRNVTGNSEAMLSSKLEATIRLMKEIIKEDSENHKILLFTTMEFGTRIWQYLAKVLQKAKLPLIEVTRNDFGKNISDFQSSVEPNILLCSLSMCANGLNLTQANHIIFLDPPHSFSAVEQAIGKMHRVGQKREMKVYHMLVEGSIDEEIRKVVKSEKEDLTVGQLRQIFGIIWQARAFGQVAHGPPVNRRLARGPPVNFFEN